MQIIFYLGIVPRVISPRLAKCLLAAVPMAYNILVCHKFGCAILLPDFTPFCPVRHWVDGLREFWAACFVGAVGFDPGVLVAISDCLLADFQDLDPAFLITLDFGGTAGILCECNFFIHIPGMRLDGTTSEGAK